MKIYITFYLALISCSCFSQKEVAITIDDLPMANPKIGLEHTLDVNNRLLEKLRKYDVRVTGFINESQIQVLSEEGERIKILQNWVDNQHEIGNHTYSHISFNETSLEEYIDDIKKGEVITKDVLKKNGKVLKFFRPPFLTTTNSTICNCYLDTFLIHNNYLLVPSTIESSDYIFHLLYLQAKINNDSVTANDIVNEYIEFTERRFDFYDSLSIQVVGRRIKQIFLCHDNQLNADHFDKIILMLKSKGYKFITLDEALEDEVYKWRDTYNGANGISWIQRWNTKNRDETLKLEPKVDKDITERYKSISKASFFMLLKPRILGNKYYILSLLIFITLFQILLLTIWKMWKNKPATSSKL